MFIIARDFSGNQLWTATIGRSGYNSVYGVALAPGGDHLYVAGQSDFVIGEDGIHRGNAFVAAFDTESGQVEWQTAFGREGVLNWGTQVVASDDGSRVYVTGGTQSEARGTWKAMTAAFEAATGEETWREVWTPSDSTRTAEGIGLATVDRDLYIKVQVGQYLSYQVLAYRDDRNPSTDDRGLLRWTRNHTGQAGEAGTFTYGGIAATASTVILTGGIISFEGPALMSTGVTSTVAYSATTGNALWHQTYPPPPETSERNFGWGLTLSPDGRTVYVAGMSSASPQWIYRASLLAYDVSSGALLWSYTYDPATYAIATTALVSPDGGTVYLVGTESTVFSWSPHPFVSALRATDGEQIWSAIAMDQSSEFYGPGRLQAGLSPDGSTLVLSAQEPEWVVTTIAYRP